MADPTQAWHSAPTHHCFSDCDHVHEVLRQPIDPTGKTVTISWAQGSLTIPFHISFALPQRYGSIATERS
jgi:hypothetical protein